MDAQAYVWNGLSFDLMPNITSVTLMGTEAQIDSMVLTMVQGASKLMAANPSGAVFVVVNHGGYTLRFDGYLDIGQPIVVKSAAVDNRVNLLGVTHVLRASTARSWSNALPQNIAQDIVLPYHLGLEMDSVSEPLDFFSQGDSDSDWATLVRLADATGHALSSCGGVVRLVDVPTELRRAASRSYQTLVLPSPGGGVSNVSQFKVSSTTTPSGIDYRDTTMFGVDALGQRFSYRTTFEPDTSTIDPEFTVMSTKQFTSLQDAVVEARRVKNMARYTIVAKAGISGYLPVQPGRHVLINDPNGVYGGWWYVTDAQYTINDTVASTYITAVHSPLSNLAPIDVPPRRPASTVLRFGHWQLDKNWVLIS